MADNMADGGDLDVSTENENPVQREEKIEYPLEVLYCGGDLHFLLFVMCLICKNSNVFWMFFSFHLLLRLVDKIFDCQPDHTWQCVVYHWR